MTSWRGTVRALLREMRIALPAAVSEVIKAWVPQDQRVAMRRIPAELRLRAPVWRQRATLIGAEALAPFQVGFIGPPSELPAVADLLRLHWPEPVAPMTFEAALRPETAIFSAWPIPGAMRVPALLRTLVPLGATVGETTSSFEPELRRRLRRLSERCSVRQVTSAEDATRIHREMMVTFARARHDDRAELVPEQELARLAQDSYLAVVSLDGQPVAAHSGQSYERNGQRCFEALRFGYPVSVFSDQHRMSDANTLNAHCALEHAVAAGDGVFDFGTSPAAPDGGLLQFKRRRGGAVSAFGCPSALWFRPPQVGIDSFFWRWPLFSIDAAGLVLHLGVPSGVPQAEVAARLKGLAYSGLDAVRLHVGPQPADEIVALAREIFSSPAGAVHGKGCARRIEVSRQPATDRH